MPGTIAHPCQELVSQEKFSLAGMSSQTHVHVSQRNANQTDDVQVECPLGDLLNILVTNDTKQTCVENSKPSMCCCAATSCASCHLRLLKKINMQQFLKKCPTISLFSCPFAVKVTLPLPMACLQSIVLFSNTQILTDTTCQRAD